MNPTNNRAGGVRRVGSVSMGFSLIAAGICAMLAMFLPAFDWMLVLRLSPLILILLGGEILYTRFTHRQDKIVYEFLSIFFCFLLISAAFGMMALYASARYYGAVL